jgi:triosephosphate isomerase
VSIFFPYSLESGDHLVRRKLIAGNWKMNLNRAGAVALAQAVAEGQTRLASDVDLLVCPSHVYLDAVQTCFAAMGSMIAVGAQDVYFEPDGAFTGETSTKMLKDLDCRYVILGHSERRHILGETDALINRKVLAAISADLIPILCVGETLAEREEDKTEQIVDSQLTGSLRGISADQVANVVIAYEPVWAIGTGKTATPQQAQEVHALVRQWLNRHYNQATSERIQILYGGSVKPDNAGNLLSQPDIDGALIGGASLQADSFLAIANAAEVGVN